MQRLAVAGSTANQIEEKLKELENITINEPSPAELTWWSVNNAMTMSSAVLLFGVIIICLSTWLIRSGSSSESVLRIYGTIMIIVVSVFLVVAGYSNDQIAPVTGLLGTIAGYLLGKGTQKRDED